MATLTSPFIVHEIETIDYGHKRVAHLLDTRTGDEHTVLFGDAITEQRIRFMAPMLAGKIKKTKRGDMSNDKQRRG